MCVVIASFCFRTGLWPRECLSIKTHEFILQVPFNEAKRKTQKLQFMQNHNTQKYDNITDRQTQTDIQLTPENSNLPLKPGFHMIATIAAIAGLNITRSRFVFPSAHFLTNFNLDKSNSRQLVRFSISLERLCYRELTVWTLKPMAATIAYLANALAKTDGKKSFSFRCLKENFGPNPTAEVNPYRTKLVIWW